jgi:uncharacterized RDD family membrane protein YckC
MAQPYQPVAIPDGPAPGVTFGAPVPRLIAYLIDIFITGAASGLLFAVLGTVIAVAGSNDRGLLAGLGFMFSFLGFLAIYFLYFPYFWSHGGQTPGMKLLHVRVVRDEDGGPIGWGSGFLRLIGYAISGSVFYLGFIWILVDKRKRGWSDLIAGTCVIKA